VRQLADWGANVIKVDALLDYAAGEQPGGPRRGSDFQNLHRNKRAMIPSLKANVGGIVVTTLDPHHPWIIGDLTAALPGKSPCGGTTCASRAGWAAPTKRQK
jgi:hypothetical protein